MIDSSAKDLYRQTANALISGGDDRVIIQSNNYNKYNGSNTPNTNSINIGSCTCNNISPKMFEYANAELNKINDAISIYQNNTKINRDVSGAHPVDLEFTDIRNRILRSLDLLGKADVCLFPSGSDAEMFVSTIGLIRRKQFNNNRELSMLNIIVGSGELGSGTANAVVGKHFSSISPMYNNQMNNQYITGISSDDIELISIPVRNNVGNILSMYEIQDTIASKLELGMIKVPDRICILHMVCGTKTGIIAPSLEFIYAMQTIYQERLIVVADCCQTRFNLSYISECIKHGIICIITGSKFYGGPPFRYNSAVYVYVFMIIIIYCICSGALIIPNTIIEEVESQLCAMDNQCIVNTIPSGLQNYISHMEVISYFVYK